jgi:cobalt-zinc-cadmium efflux system protein
MAEGHDHSHVAKGLPESRLLWALALTGGYLILQVVGGLLSRSLALLADAGHMLTDVAALAIALIAIRIGKRPADRQRTFGYKRLEILAAALNAGALFVIAGFIIVQALQRLRQSAEVETGLMLWVAVGGLVVNLIAARILASGSKDSLNVKGAYLEVLADLLGSVAVVGAALLIRFTGWQWLDPVLGAALGLWVLPRAWTLLLQSVNILLEGVPEAVDIAKLQADLEALPEVTAVHDLHVWAVTQGENSLSVHLVTEIPDFSLIQQAREVAEKHGIEHVTVQLEPPDMLQNEHATHLRWNS